MEDYFMLIRDLAFAGTPGGAEPKTAWGCLEPWLPKGMGQLAVMHNYRPGKETFDYIIVTEKLVYFAILYSDGTNCSLRSVKTFRQDAFYALGHMVEPCPGESGEDFPHVRVLLRDGKRLMLVFRGGGDEELLARLQQLAQSTFFRN